MQLMFVMLLQMQVMKKGENYELEYPFAAGYSRSAMNQAIDDLSKIVTQLREAK